MNGNLISKPLRERGRDKMYNTWHRLGDGDELLLVLEGSGSVVFKSGIYPIVSRGLYYIGRGALHYTILDEIESYDRIKMKIDPSVLRLDREICEFFEGKESVFAVLSQSDTERARKLFEDIYARDDISMVRAEALANVLGLLVMLGRGSAGSLNTSGDIISDTISYINDRIGEPINIDDLCAAVHTSKYHLCRKFKSHMGLTIVQYVTETRVAHAKEMLLSERELSISEISEKCGFTNLSYFCAVFKKIAGVSPLTYRSKCEIGE